MSKHDSSLSKDQYNLLKSFKKQITHPHSSNIAKQPAPVQKAAEQEQEDDFALFQKQMQSFDSELPKKALCVVQENIKSDMLFPER